MKPASCKARGRKFQQWVRDKLVEILTLNVDDVESRSMGAQGEDIMLAAAARAKFPYSIECKNTERLNLWNAYAQAKENSGDYEPLVFIKRNRQKPLVVIDAEEFIWLVNQKNHLAESVERQLNRDKEDAEC